MRGTRSWALLLPALLAAGGFLLAGCESTGDGASAAGDPTPSGTRAAPDHAPPSVPATPEAGRGGPGEVPPVAPPAVEGREFGMETSPGAEVGDLLVAAASGASVLPGVVVLDPVLDAEAATAVFRVRNDAGTDLPDLILSVIFALPTGDARSPLHPRIETVEVPLRRGETREVRVALSGRRSGERPARFRVVAGLPEILAARVDEGHPGTTFLGGLVECSALEADLTAEIPQVTVTLEDRGTAMPPLEAQLLLARAGSLTWSGPWILVPRASGEGARVRTIHWNLPRGTSAAGCTLYLRVREKR